MDNQIEELKKCQKEQNKLLDRVNRVIKTHKLDSSVVARIAQTQQRMAYAVQTYSKHLQGREQIEKKIEISKEVLDKK